MLWPIWQGRGHTAAAEQEEKSSDNRAKAKLKVAKLHAKIADCRMDNLHKLFRKRINENQAVCDEFLKVKKMIRSPKLPKALADAGRGERIRQLQYRGEWAGRSVVAVAPFFLSPKRCSRCGYTMPKMALKVRSWVCPEYGVNHDRDVKAGKNIKAAGFAVLAPGESVTPEPLNAAQVRLCELEILAVYGGEQSNLQNKVCVTVPVSGRDSLQNDSSVGGAVLTVG